MLTGEHSTFKHFLSWMEFFPEIFFLTFELSNSGYSLSVSAACMPVFMVIKVFLDYDNYCI